MPLYDYTCIGGHTFEQSGSINDDWSWCPNCGLRAYRQAVYYEQFTITETGGVKGTVDRRRRDHMGDKLRMLEKSSIQDRKATGKDSGPMVIKDWQK